MMQKTNQPDQIKNRPSHWIIRRYSIALALVAILAISGFAVFQALISTHDATLAVVNMAGRQRMLSQRISLFIQRLSTEQCPQERTLCLQELHDAATLFQRSHLALIHGDPAQGIPSQPLASAQALYAQGTPPLDSRIRRYAETALQLADQAQRGIAWDDTLVISILNEGTGPLLADLDRVVLAYQHDGEHVLLRLRRLELGLTVAMLAVLALEAMLIFRPMAARMDRQVAEIDAVNADLEQRVIARTQDLEAAKADAESAHRSKSRFLAAASHDMLQPLEAGEMFLGLLRHEPHNARTLALLADLQRTHKTMRHLVRSVLDVSRLEAGVITPHPQPVVVRDMLQSLAKELGPLAADKNLRLNVVPTSAITISDPQLLERIVRNLLSNAIRYTHEGGILLGARRRGDRLWIHVIDSGPGIAEDDQHRIFAEFVQVGSGGRDRSEGLGLGLTIVDRLCHLLGHRLVLRSRLGHGSDFAVECPLAPKGLSPGL